MSNLPAELHYAPTHEWARSLGDGLIQVGITDFAQQQLGDVVYIRLPDPGAQVKAGHPVAVIESVKAASDIHSPVSGEIVAVNPALEGEPEQVNQAPYEAWMFTVRPSDAAGLDGLLSVEAYQATVQD
jgi:glycine cleavage system H protein